MGWQQSRYLQEGLAEEPCALAGGTLGQHQSILSQPHAASLEPIAISSYGAATHMEALGKHRPVLSRRLTEKDQSCDACIAL